mmetsp:Transcript_54682/g.122325  ORF Transcript_54682/g.122325 Transcript_54682/m.122325 type:complete len:211 (-) Transcript_54682:904-1536(-)
MAFWVFAAAQLYAQLAAALLPHQPVQGSPLYSWLMALPLQCIVIPGLALHAWLASGLSIQEWLSAPYEDLPCQICQDAFIYMFIAYMVKDAFVGMTLKYWMHHLLSAAVGLHYLGGDSSTFIAVAAILEVGSATSTLYTLLPRSRVARQAHATGMTMSNVMGTYLGLSQLSTSKKSNGACALLCAIGAGFVVCRQLHCWQSLRANSEGQS